MGQKVAGMAGEARYNETDWDPARGNTEVTVLSSSSGSTNRTSSDQTNHNAEGVLIFVDATLGGTTPSFDVNVEVKDPQSGNYVAVISASSLTSTGTFIFNVGPGAAAGTGIQAAADVPLPRTWRVVLNNFDTADADETYTTQVGASYVRV